MVGQSLLGLLRLLFQTTSFNLPRSHLSSVGDIQNSPRTQKLYRMVIAGHKFGGQVAGHCRSGTTWT